MIVLRVSLPIVLLTEKSVRSTSLHPLLEFQIAPLVAQMKPYHAQIVVAGTALSKFFLGKKNCS